MAGRPRKVAEPVLVETSEPEEAGNAPAEANVVEEVAPLVEEEPIATAPVEEIVVAEEAPEPAAPTSGVPAWMTGFGDSLPPQWTLPEA